MADFVLETAVSPRVVFADPATVELSDAPIPQDWIIEGRPEARSRRLGTSADGAASIMAWSCTAGRFHWYYSVDETIHFISGEVFVTDEKGEVHRLGAGDMVFFPAGTHSIWHVTKEVRKLAVCRHAMPFMFGFALRVWNKLSSLLRGPAEDADPLSATPAASQQPVKA